MGEYCVRAKFSEKVNFNDFLQSGEPIGNEFHCHVVSSENEIEVRLFYSYKTRFERKFSGWAQSINWGDFGNFIEIDSTGKEGNPIGIDLNEANILKISNGSGQEVNGQKYLSVFVDRVKFHWEPTEELIGTAEFYLNDNGFQMISSYYAQLYKEDNMFTFHKMRDMDGEYQIGDVTFNPKFDFIRTDSFDERESKILKKPTFQFNFPDSKSEQELLDVWSITSLASSFYFRKIIDFSLARIRLTDSLVVIRKIHNPYVESTDKGTLWPVLSYSNIHKMFRKIKVESFEAEEMKKNRLIVEKFVQSMMLDVRSSILLKFAVLEICKGRNSESPEKFKLIGSKRNKTIKFKAAKKELLKLITEEERQDFENKWATYSAKLLLKPMRSPFEQFFDEVGMKTSDFQVKFSTIKEIRDAITHGSTVTFSRQELEHANAMLYRICIGLILDTFQLEDGMDAVDWKWNDE